MFDPNELLALRRLVQSERRTTRESLQLACVYVVQLLASTSLLLWAYSLAGAHGVLWAIVSAVLVLQPGVEQSIAASAVRIAANAVGGLIGFTVGEFFGTAAPQLLLALIATVFASEFLRLDVGLRTACVATLIVMTTNEGHVRTSSFERLFAVLVGCVLAVGVQMIVEKLRTLAGWSNPAPAAPQHPASNATARSE